MSPLDSEEVSLIINELKNNKGSGSDSIPAEFLMIGGPTLDEDFTHLIFNIWETKKMPNSWKELVNNPLFKKKCASTNCKNYWRISLLNTAYEVFYITE